MLRRLLICILFLAAMPLLFPACGEDPPPKTAQTSPPPKKAEAKPAPEPEQKQSQPEPKKEEPKPWPYLTGDKNAGVADDLLAKNIVLIFDGSGSMAKSGCSGNQSKIAVAKAAVAEWSASVDPKTNLGLVAFHGKSRDLLIKNPAAGDRTELLETIDSIAAGGKTPLANAMAKAFFMLEFQAQSQLGYGDFTIVVVTDGIANDPKRLGQTVEYLLKLTPITIYTIGFCITGDHSLNQKGRTFYRAANNPEQLREGLKEVLAESEEFDLTDSN